MSLLATWIVLSFVSPAHSFESELTFNLGVADTIELKKGGFTLKFQAEKSTDAGNGSSCHLKAAARLREAISAPDILAMLRQFEVVRIEWLAAKMDEKDSEAVQRYKGENAYRVTSETYFFEQSAFPQKCPEKFMGLPPVNGIVNCATQADKIFVAATKTASPYKIKSSLSLNLRSLEMPGDTCLLPSLDQIREHLRAVAHVSKPTRDSIGAGSMTLAKRDDAKKQQEKLDRQKGAVKESSSNLMNPLQEVIYTLLPRTLSGTDGGTDTTIFQ